MTPSTPSTPPALTATASLVDTLRQIVDDVGPRGSATVDESKAAGYIVEQLTRLGLSPSRQEFLGAASSYAPYALCAGVVLLGLILFWQPQPTSAATAFILSTLGLVSLLREMRFQDNVLRWVLPKEDSQNICVTLDPRVDLTLDPTLTSKPAGAPIFITAHLDTHRTPLLFSSPAWLQVFAVMLPLGLACIAVLIALFAIGTFVPAQSLRQLALLPGAGVAVILALTVQADQTDFGPGANDNASGLAVALNLVERIQAEPTQNRPVIVVFTGCEEVGGYGADAYFQAHQTSLPGAIHLVIDQVASQQSDPCVVRSERFLAQAAADPALLKIAEDAIAAHPALNARMVDLSTGYGEMSIGVKHRLRVIGLGSLDAAGQSRHWHQATDTSENIDESALARSAELAYLLVREFDRAS